MYDINFVKMVVLAKEFLKREITKTQDALEASEAVRHAYESAPDKRLVVCDKAYPFEDELHKYPEPLFVVSPRPDGSWRLHTVSLSASNFFQNRKDLPAEWAGLRDEEMARISGVPDAMFCHNGRFLAVAKTKEGALALAGKALE